MISGTCDLSQRPIYVDEKCKVAGPGFGAYTHLQFKLDIPIEEINEYCKSIYGDNPFEIREEKMENGIKIDELLEFIKSLHELNEKYVNINLLDLCTVLRKIIELLKNQIYQKKIKNLWKIWKILVIYINPEHPDVHC